MTLQTTKDNIETNPSEFGIHDYKTGNTTSKPITGIRRPSDNLLGQMLSQVSAPENSSASTSSSISSSSSNSGTYDVAENNDSQTTVSDLQNSIKNFSRLSILDLNNVCNSNNQSETSANSTRTSTATNSSTKKYSTVSSIGLGKRTQSTESIVTNNTSISGKSSFDELHKLHNHSYKDHDIVKSNNSGAEEDKENQEDGYDNKLVIDDTNITASTSTLTDLVNGVPQSRNKQPHFYSATTSIPSAEVQRYVISQSNSSSSSPSFAGNTNTNANTSNNNSTTNKQPATPHFQYKMTPSQRLRMRREQNKNSLKNSIKHKEYFYDKIENIDNKYDTMGKPHSVMSGVTNSNNKSNSNSSHSSLGNTSVSPNNNSDDLLVWNVPVALNSALFYQNMHNNTNNSKNTANHKKSSKPQGKHAFTRANSTPVFPTYSNNEDLYFNDMPVSPIPGITVKGDKMNTFYDLTTKNLSKVYMNSSKSYSHTQLQNRMDSMESLPQMVKTAQEEGLEDLRLISDEKLKNLTSTRPVWLPTKSAKEIEKHESEISRTMSLASIDKINLNKKFIEMPLKLNEQRLQFNNIIDEVLKLSQPEYQSSIKSSGEDQQNNSDHTQAIESRVEVENENFKNTINRNSLLLKLQSIVCEHPNIITLHKRLSTYRKLIYSSIYYENFNEEIYTNYKELYGNKYLQTDFNQSKITEIKVLVKLNLSEYGNNSDDGTDSQNKIPESLMTLLKMKTLTPQGLQTKDIILFNVLLKFYDSVTTNNTNTSTHLSAVDDTDNCSPKETPLEIVWEISEILSMICFNDTIQKEFDEHVMKKHGIIHGYLKNEYNFEKEFQATNLNFDNFFHILNKLPNRFVLWILDILILSNLIVFKKNDLEHYHKKLNTKLAEIKLTNPTSLKSTSKSKSDSEIISHDYEAMLFQYWNRKYMKNNYKIMLSLMLNVLLNYHFGYNDFHELRALDSNKYNILGISSTFSSISPSESLSSTSSFSVNPPTTWNRFSRSSLTLEKRASFQSLQKISENEENTPTPTSPFSPSSSPSSLLKGDPMDYEYLYDEDEYILMEAFIKKWLHYTKKF